MPLSIEDLIDIKCKQALERLIEQKQTQSDCEEKKRISSTKDEDNSLTKFPCNLYYDDPHSKIAKIKFDEIEVIEDKDEDTGEDTEEMDPKLLSLPLVYTTKLDHMGLFKNKPFEISNNKQLIDIVNYRSNPVKNKFRNIEKDKESMVIEISDDDDDIEIITTESLNNNKDGIKPTRTKPFYDDGDIVFHTIVTSNDDEENTTKVCTDEEIEDNISDTQRVKLSSDMFKKPHIRKYNPSELLKNPDFNISLKRLNTEFVNSLRNLILMSYLKRLTVDVSKGFETKLVNGRMYFKQDEENTYLNQDNINNTKILRDNYEIPIDTSIYDGGDICNSENNVRDALDANEVISIIPKRNTMIRLPNMTEVRCVNQKLLTAEVLPVQMQDSLIKKAQDYLVSHTQGSLVYQKGNDLLSQTCDSLVSQKGCRLVSQIENSFTNWTHNSLIEQTQNDLVGQKQGNFISKTQENLFNQTPCSLVGQTENNVMRQTKHDLDNRTGGDCIRKIQENLFTQTQNSLDSQAENNLIRKTQSGCITIQGNLMKQTQANLNNQTVFNLIRETQESPVKQTQNSLNRDTINNLFDQTQDNLFRQTQENLVSQTGDILIRQTKKLQKPVLKKTMIIPNIINPVTNTAPSNISNNTSINESEKAEILPQGKTIINLQVQDNVAKDILTQPAPKISPIPNTCTFNNIYLASTPEGNKVLQNYNENCFHQKESIPENKAVTTNQITHSNIISQPENVHPTYVNINRNILPVSFNRVSEVDVSQHIAQNSTPLATPTHTFVPSVTEYLVLPNGELSYITNTERQNSTLIADEVANKVNLITIQSNHINLGSIKNDQLGVITTNSSATTNNTNTEIFYLSTSPHTTGASGSSFEIKPLSTISQQEIANNKGIMCKLNMQDGVLSIKNFKNKNDTGPEQNATVHNKTVSTKSAPLVPLALKPDIIPVAELETRIGIRKKTSAVKSSQQILQFAKRNQGRKQPIILRSAYSLNSQNFAKQETTETKNQAFLLRKENHLDYKKSKDKNPNCSKNINQTATSLNVSSVINEYARIRIPLKVQERKKRFSDNLKLYYDEPLTKNRKISTPKEISSQTITPSTTKKSNEDPNLKNWIILGL